MSDERDETRNRITLKEKVSQGAWLSWSVEHVTLGLTSCEFKPHVGPGAYLKK